MSSSTLIITLNHSFLAVHYTIYQNQAIENRLHSAAVMELLKDDFIPSFFVSPKCPCHQVRGKRDLWPVKVHYIFFLIRKSSSHGSFLPLKHTHEKVEIQAKLCNLFLQTNYYNCMLDYYGYQATILRQNR